MSKQRTSKTEYKVYYGVDSNAALAPQFAPQKERKTAPKKAPDRRAKEKAERKTAAKLCARVVVLSVTIAAMGFCVVQRNAEIYKNTRTIRDLAKEKVNLELQVRTAEKDCSAGNDIDSYFNTAENQLALSYPEDDSVVSVAVPSVSEEQDARTQESGNFYDTVLDWLNSLERRIKSWA